VVKRGLVGQRERKAHCVVCENDRMLSSTVEGRLRQANLRSTRRSPKRSQFPKRGGIPIGRGDADFFAGGWWRGVNDNRLDTCRRRTGEVKTNSLEEKAVFADKQPMWANIPPLA